MACDPDVYAIDADEGPIEISVTFQHDEGDIDAILRDSAGNVIAASVSQTDNENLTFDVATPGLHYLEVYPYLSDTDQRHKNTYDVAFSFVEPRCPPDDARDDGPGDDTIELATPAVSQQRLDGIACDLDYFAVTVPAGANIRAELLFSHAVGDLDMMLLDPTGNLVSAAESVTDDELIDYTVDQAGTYYLRVYPYGVPITTSNTYQLEVVFESPTPFQLLDKPCVVLDTRLSSDGALQANTSRTVFVTGSMPSSQGTNVIQCVPQGAASAMISITAVDPDASGNLRLSESGVVPTGGVVNYAPNGLDNSNTITVPIALDGKVDVFANQGTTDVTMAVIGYQMRPGFDQGLSLPGTAVRFVGVTPCALLDTRTGTGAFDGPFTSATLTDLDLSGPAPASYGTSSADCGIPIDAEGILMNVVAVGPAGQGVINVGQTPPNAPTLSYQGFIPGMNNAVTTVAPLEAGELSSISISGASAHVRLVALGYYVSDGGQSFTPVNPCAAFDTRSRIGGQGTRIGGSTTSFRIAGLLPEAQGGDNAGSCGIPVWADSVLINLVAANPLSFGNLRVSAAGVPATGGVLNFANLTPAMNNSNAVVVPLSDLGAIDVFVNNPFAVGDPVTDVRGVVLGYYS